MPRMTGAELCSSLRETSKAPSSCSPSAAKSDPKSDALDRGADDYVVKPFNINELLARIRANLRRRSQEMMILIDVWLRATLSSMRMPTG